MISIVNMNYTWLVELVWILWQLIKFLLTCCVQESFKNFQVKTLFLASFWNETDLIQTLLKQGCNFGYDDKLKPMKNWETIASVWELYNAVQCVYIHTFVYMYTYIHLKLREVKGFQHCIQKSKLIRLSQRRIGR